MQQRILNGILGISNVPYRCMLGRVGGGERGGKGTGSRRAQAVSPETA